MLSSFMASLAASLAAIFFPSASASFASFLSDAVCRSTGAFTGSSGPMNMEYGFFFVAIAP